MFYLRNTYHNKKTITIFFIASIGKIFFEKYFKKVLTFVFLGSIIIITLREWGT